MDKDIFKAMGLNTYPKGYSLKKYKLKEWIYDNGYTQPFVAKRLGLSPKEFKRKLRDHEKFHREQIKNLVYLMGAEFAFNVLYFPSKRTRKKIWWCVFGNDRNKKEDTE
jgi:hypothetical protein